MTKPKSHTLKLTGATNDWVCVKEPDGATSFVAKVLVSGLEVDPVHSGLVEVDAVDFAFEGEYEPVLLIEAAPWYNSSEGDGDE